jgi:hypothetical protein
MSKGTAHPLTYLCVPLLLVSEPSEGGAARTKMPQVLSFFAGSGCGPAWGVGLGSFVGFCSLRRFRRGVCLEPPSRVLYHLLG